MSIKSKSVEVDVCLISPGLPSSNPRLVKEATALTQAGYRVHCVVGDYATPLRDYDEQLLRDAGASWTRVTLGSWPSYKLRRVRQILAERVSRWVKTQRLLHWSASPQSSRLLNATQRVRARLYIGHTIPALSVSVLAAKRQNALAGFDAEDFHSGETGQPARDQSSARIEQYFLRRVAHRTAASPLIADAYQQPDCPPIVVAYNTFPVPTGWTPDVLMPASDEPLKLYWFSQTVGPGRGLEEAIQGLAKAARRTRLTLRGIVSNSYRDHLQQLASRLSVPDLIEFAEMAHPDSMIPLAAEHHIGLTIEIRSPINKDLCLANKLFTNLAAGRPQILSATRAHQQIAPELGEAVQVVDLNSAEEFARIIDHWGTSAEDYRLASETALRLSSGPFSWAQDAERIVMAVRSHIGSPGEGGRH